MLLQSLANVENRNNDSRIQFLNERELLKGKKIIYTLLPVPSSFHVVDKLKSNEDLF